MDEERTTVPEETEESADSQPRGRGRREKEPKPSKADKKEARARAKEASREKKEWEDGIVANKRVKREENRRRWRKAMLILLIFALSVTSVVYIMLLFIEENNVRITASSGDRSRSILLSADGEQWTPYLQAQGPEHMKDISYDAGYDRERIPNKAESLAAVQPQTAVIGNKSGQNYISFGFMLRNNSDSTEALSVDYGMSLAFNDRGLDKAIRVMWAEGYSLTPEAGGVTVYAAPGSDAKLAGLSVNQGREPGDYIEMISYPAGTDVGDTDYLVRYEQELTDEQIAAGFEATTPFLSDGYVFQNNAALKSGEIMYVYVTIWIEGSDLECVDSALGGYVTLSIDFSC